MAKILRVVQYPDPILRKACEPVTEFDGDLQTLIDDMLETMYADAGMGIAANQVAVSKRIFIMDEHSQEAPNPIIFINPEVVDQSEDEITEDEGCLSFRGLRIMVSRPRQATIKALDRNGKEFLCEREGYAARCMLHEYDHLQGITFFDHLSPLKRKMAEKKLQKFKRGAM